MLRSYLRTSSAGLSTKYIRRLASNLSPVTFVPMRIPRFTVCAVSLLAVAFLISACASRDETVIQENTSPGEATLQGDRPSYAPGSEGMSAAHWR